jgi:hypothetical protein
LPLWPDLSSTPAIKCGDARSRLPSEMLSDTYRKRAINPRQSRQQRLNVFERFRRRQFTPHPEQPRIGLHTIGLGRLDHGRNDGAGMGAGGRVAEQPSLPAHHNLGVILPMSGKRWKSSTSGMHFMGAVSGGNTASTELPVSWFTSRSNPA